MIVCAIIFALNILSFSCAQSVTNLANVREGIVTGVSKSLTEFELKQAYSELEHSFNKLKSLYHDSFEILNIPFLNDFKSKFNITNRQFHIDLIYAILRRNYFLFNAWNGPDVIFVDGDSKNHILSDSVLLLLGIYTLVINTLSAILEQNDVFGNYKLNKLKYSRDITGISEIKNMLHDMHLKWTEFSILLKNFINNLSKFFYNDIQNYNDFFRDEILLQLRKIRDMNFIDKNQFCKDNYKICGLKNDLINLRYQIEVKSNELIRVIY
ncbi:hypothetical protein BDCR2A_01116 [Borrelia duttonii CR2A]|uniref:Cytosolic protein n=1 Tax=Borrelia duttonii CR2A TaxID=1432657 RepID=W6TXP1_9SPIR|nr:hypothetical protein [Borrelia duttonii]ETZ17921.1 hypothetical protein BDCR2A_01116 [Borrelia duttonii CR2A]